MDEDLVILAARYEAARKEGPVVLYLPNGMMYGFQTADAALAYAEASRALEGKGPIESIWYVIDGEGMQFDKPTDME